MSAFNPLNRLSRILPVCTAIFVGVVISGCADDPLVDPFVTPQPQSFIPTDTAFSLPASQQPTQLPSQQTTQETTLQSPEPITEQPAQLPPQSDANDRVSNTYAALQRLQPAAQYDFTVTSDGATGSEVVDYRNSVLIDEGEDSVLLTPELPNSQIEACLYREGLYLCLRVFENFDVSEAVPGGMSLFSLDENGFGSGVFVLCPDIHRNPDFCINQITNNTPTGTLFVSAGIQSRSFNSGQNPVYDGGDYSRYLARSNPSINTDFIRPSSQLLKTARAFASF